MGVLSLWHLIAAARARQREQWLSPLELAAVRSRRLHRLAEVASRTPHYREVFQRAGLVPSDITEETLEQLPILEKTDLAATESGRMLTQPRTEIFPVTTSGSTGMPVKVFRNHRDQAQVSAVWNRMFKAYGHGVRDTQLNINTGGIVAAKGPVAALRKLGLLPKLHNISSFAPVDEHVELLRRVKPSMFSSYAISLELIAERVLDSGITDLRPKVVYSCAMPLSDRGRKLAERAFGVAPLDVYVAAELGVVGWECPEHRGALHLNDDVQIVEIIDTEGRRIPDGEVGQVVLTQLACLVQPLIRYRLGDLAARLPSSCQCGRGLALLSPVQGRTRHVIRAPDGRLIYGMVLSTVVKPFPVARWQAQQPAADTLRLVVVPTREWQADTAQAIIGKLRDRLGQAMRYEVVTAADIPLAPTGKFQTIVPLTEPLLPAERKRAV